MGDVVRHAAEEVAARPGHPFVADHDQVGLHLFGDVQDGVGRVALDRMGLRLDPGGGRNDLEDILNLMQVVGMKERSDILRFASRFYPEARVSGKLLLAVDHLWNEYCRRLRRPAHEAPCYLGRSGPQS